jgi:hypothetical protein
LAWTPSLFERSSTVYAAVDVEGMIAGADGVRRHTASGAVDANECALCRDEIPVERATDLN